MSLALQNTVKTPSEISIINFLFVTSIYRLYDICMRKIHLHLLLSQEMQAEAALGYEYIRKWI